MEQVVLIIHLMLALAIIALVLIQRSEGGGLGIGSSGGMGGLATPGGTASALTRVTSILAFCFFGTSLLLGIMAGNHGQKQTLIDQIGNEATISSTSEPANEAGDDLPAVPEEMPEVPLE